MPIINVDEAPVIESEFHKSKVFVSPKVLNSMHMAVRMNEISAGYAHESHTHIADEMLIILDGRGEYVEMDDKYIIEPMSVVYIPRGTVHSVRVVGKTPMKLIVIKAPPD
jgi:quercetin dioxygenase-like cupin family protein